MFKIYWINEYFEGRSPEARWRSQNRARSSEAAFTYLHILTYTYRHLHILTYTYMHLHMFANLFIHIPYTCKLYTYSICIHITALPVHCYDRFQKCHPHRGWEAHFRYFRSAVLTPQFRRFSLGKMSAKSGPEGVRNRSFSPRKTSGIWGVEDGDLKYRKCASHPRWG